MTYQTQADGSPLPTYLTQSPRTPFAIGKIQSLGKTVYGYSEQFSPTVAAETSLNLMTFVLDQSAMLKFQFQTDWQAQADKSVGFAITLDGTEVYRWVGMDRGSERNSELVEVTLFIPAERTVIPLWLNPDGSTSQVKANVQIVGEYI